MTHSIEAARARIERLEIMVSTLRHDLRGQGNRISNLGQYLE
jgi:hypothetical protein